MKMNVVQEFRLTEISRWAKQHLQEESTIISDDSCCFTAVSDADLYRVNIVKEGGFQMS